jgi:hypothetical protein
MKNKLKAWLLLAVMMLAGTSMSLAQNVLASITGKVVDEKGQPVIGAIVTVKNESTGFTLSGPTDADGRYRFKEVPLGTPYTVTAQYIGYGDQKRTGYTLNQGEVLRVNFKMSESSQEIAEVDVVANSLKKNVDTEGASTTISQLNMQRLPVNGRNFTNLMDLSPLSQGNRLSGQLASSTGFNIDGMSSKNPISGGAANMRKGSPYALTMEAIKEFKIVTNAYDVTYGRAGGGLINAVSKSGTNQLHGSAFGYMRADWLSSDKDILGNKRNSDFSTYQYGFSLGGPIIKNRMHFFVAWDHQRDTQPLRIADIRNSSDEVRYNLTQSTLNRYISIAQEKYGLSTDTQEYGSFDKKSNTDAVFARIDWQISPTQLLTVRDNFNYNKMPYSQGDNSSINLLESYSDCNTSDNSLMATLRSIVSPTAINELKGQWMHSMEETKPNGLLPSANIPRAIVESVTSTVNGSEVSTTIQLGGQRFTPENFHDNVYQLIDNFFWTHNKINFTFGVDLMYSHLNSRYGSETNGRFYFTGLDNFEALTPYRYARDIYLTDDEDAQHVKERIINAGIYAQAEKDLFPGFHLMAGLRIDDASYLDKGNYNEIADRTLGMKTNRGLSLFLIQPRLQATWDLNEKHTDIFKLGAGIFASDINNYAMVNNMVFDGSRIATVDIQGDQVPTPDFVSYRNDPSTAPGLDLFNNPNIEKTYTINCNGKNAQVPVIYKANFSYTHYFSDRLRVGAAFYTTLARHNYLYRDRNMVDEPYFRIAAEDNRGVYVPAETINTSNGATNWMNGRKTTELGRVLELNSDGKVNQFAFVIDATWRYFRDGECHLSYTWNDTKDNISYNGDVANTSTLVKMVKDDPRDMSEMNYSNNQFRHKIVGYLTSPTFWGFNVGLRFSGIGGTRYSLVVRGNINGDFVSTNDLAYIYDPNSESTPQYLKDGINAILDNPDVANSTKKYIRKSFGKIAERNGGVNGFYGVFDLHIGKAIKIYKSHKLDLSLDLFNVANFFNKDWGVGKNLGNVYVYSVKGFDAEQKQFVYRVNTNAGVPNGNGNPYQFQLGLRYEF